MACTDMAIRLEVDALATGSSASKKNRSLELHLVLHHVGRLQLRAWHLARLEAAAHQLERAARCCRPSSCASARGVAVHS